MDKPSVQVLIFPIKRISSINSPPYAANKQTNKQTNKHTKKKEGQELQVIVSYWQREIQTIQMSDIYHNTFIENYDFAVLLRSLGR